MVMVTVAVTVVVALVVEHSSMPEEDVVDSAGLLETDSFFGIGFFVDSVRNAVKLLLLRYQ
jgi:hypothetical protein